MHVGQQSDFLVQIINGCHLTGGIGEGYISFGVVARGLIYQKGGFR